MGVSFNEIVTVVVHVWHVLKELSMLRVHCGLLLLISWHGGLVGRVMRGLLAAEVAAAALVGVATLSTLRSLCKGPIIVSIGPTFTPGMVAMTWKRTRVSVTNARLLTILTLTATDIISVGVPPSSSTAPTVSIGPISRTVGSVRI